MRVHALGLLPDDVILSLLVRTWFWHFGGMHKSLNNMKMESIAIAFIISWSTIADVIGRLLHSMCCKYTGQSLTLHMISRSGNNDLNLQGLVFSSLVLKLIIINELMKLISEDF